MAQLIRAYLEYVPDDTTMEGYKSARHENSALVFSNNVLPHNMKEEFLKLLPEAFDLLMKQIPEDDIEHFLELDNG